MQFQVPQFIDIEDKIMGPLTLKQFLYLAGAGAFSFILFFVLQMWLWIMLTIIMGMIAATFAFIKYNGQPMPKMFLAALKYLWLPKFYLWRYTPPAQAVPALPKIPVIATNQGPASHNPLKNLMLVLQTSTKAIAGREKSLPPPSSNNTPVAAT